ncbi:hypothetical protein JF729_06835 [Mycobacterium intracellulare]|uniref:hypothetical protein n=1 Tax=Mycobacterium intracellulare TaxID=1767 RepID=UPI001CD99A2E|nr:hypothetical protein [Mycobacterium intracellulare]MCA2247511.1 hypothetical protein [Mycobacterium intracellulare]
MSDTWIIIIGAVVAATYFVGSVVVGTDRWGTRAQRLRDIATTAVVFTGYTVIAVVLHNALPGPITMLAAIALLAAVTWTYSYYRSGRAHRDGTGPI